MIYNDELKNLIPLIHFLGQSFGDSFEFVLHDLSRPDNTIIAIENGHVTGRRVGDTLSNFTLRAIYENVKTDEDFDTFRRTASYKHNMKSHNMLIRNSDGDVRGMLCINYSTKVFRDIKNLIDQFLSKDLNVSTKSDYLVQNISFKGLALSMIENVIGEYDIPVERMRPEDKIKIISQLMEKGVFQLKGVVPQVAEILLVSEATIYRYMNNI